MLIHARREPLLGRDRHARHPCAGESRSTTLVSEAFHTGIILSCLLSDRYHWPMSASRWKVKLELRLSARCEPAGPRWLVPRPTCHRTPVGSIGNALGPAVVSQGRMLQLPADRLDPSQISASCNVSTQVACAAQRSSAQHRVRQLANATAVTGFSTACFSNLVSGLECVAGAQPCTTYVCLVFYR